MKTSNLIYSPFGETLLLKVPSELGERLEEISTLLGFTNAHVILTILTRYFELYEGGEFFE